MENIKTLVKQCLLPKPQLDNISKLLELLTGSLSSKQKLFCSRQIARVFEVLHKQGTFNKSVGDFLKQKISSFVQLVALLSEQNDKYIECLNNLTNIAQAQDIINNLNQNKAFWGKVTLGNTASWLIQQVIKAQYQQRLQCLLGLPNLINFEELTEQVSGKREREQSEPKSNPQLEAKFKKLYQTLLFSLLKDSSLTTQDHRLIIQSFPEKIFAKVSSPLNLSQYILQQFHQTSSLELKIDLLSSMFILIGKYGLQLSDFYSQLYNLITIHNEQHKSVFQVSNSKRVFKMLENSLRSSKIPFNTIVKFLKFLINKCLFQNSQFVCWILALSFNLFKKHQLLSNCLNQQSDIYIPEFKVLKNHFLPQVKGLISKLQKNLNKEDFLDISEFTAINLQKVLKHQIDNLQTAKILLPNTIQNLLQ